MTLDELLKIVEQPQIDVQATCTGKRVKKATVICGAC